MHRPILYSLWADRTSYISIPTAFYPPGGVSQFGERRGCIASNFTASARFLRSGGHWIIIWFPEGFSPRSSWCTAFKSTVDDTCVFFLSRSFAEREQLGRHSLFSRVQTRTVYQRGRDGPRWSYPLSLRVAQHANYSLARSNIHCLLFPVLLFIWNFGEPIIIFENRCDLI